MKFLQKPRATSSEPLEATTTRADRKKRQEKVHDEQVSAFFGAKKPPLLERDPNVPSRRDGKKQGISRLNARRDVEKVKDSKQEPAVFLSSGSLEKVREGPIINQESRQTVEFPGRPFLSFGSRGNEPLNSSRYTWSNSDHQSSQGPGSTQVHASRRTSDIHEESLGKRTTDLRRSRPLSRGKTLPHPPPLGSGEGAKATAHYRKGQAHGQSPFQPSVHSDQRTSDAISIISGKTREIVKIPSIPRPAPSGINYSVAQHSSSSLSHLLHECEAAVAKPPFEPLSRQSGHSSDVRRCHRDGKQTEHESVSNKENQPRPNRASLQQPPSKNPQIQSSRHATFERHESRTPLERDVSIDPGEIYNMPSLGQQFSEFDEHDVNCDANSNSGLRQGHVDWHSDNVQDMALGHGSFMMVDELAQNSDRKREDEAILVGFWKPNRLY